MASFLPLHSGVLTPALLAPPPALLCTLSYPCPSDHRYCTFTPGLGNPSSRWRATSTRCGLLLLRVSRHCCSQVCTKSSSSTAKDGSNGATIAAGAECVERSRTSAAASHLTLSGREHAAAAEAAAASRGVVLATTVPGRSDLLGNVAFGGGCVLCMRQMGAIWQRFTATGIRCQRV